MHISKEQTFKFILVLIFGQINEEIKKEKLLR